MLHSTTATAPAGSAITARRAAAGKPQQQLECTTQTTYISSDLELAWLGNVTAWQDRFCDVVRTPQQQQWTKIWLDTIAAEASGKQNITYDPAVFSRFVTTRTCPGQQQAPQESIITWIEPLAHGLRHPNSLCNMGADLFNRGYLLIANQKDVLALRAAATPSNSEACSSRSCQAIYMDLGATRWEAALNSVGQAWFYRSYAQRGITMDRLLLWEAVPVSPPSAIFAQLPKELFHKYQYFNIPAGTDYSDASHPVRMLKSIAQPADFVAFKLDIDNYAAENSILSNLSGDTAAAALVDEFFLEYHVDFKPMIERGWKGTEDPNKKLADAFKHFQQLRQKGWRAHSWV
ncbi:hypothetical protein OEZ85_003257 [Tetradesmus obliquus]|uniref:Uncharacterized protein n=1 Tax=Tetradesmus obliquus TaxID=3088 RepID=A0ABY8U022_TETOB|nr:hypothetical protein OEZ85_003257 [Tetradesmus obliquus]